TEELRSHFLMDTLFTENKLTMYYSHEDRVVISGAAPGQNELKLDAGDFLKTGFFLERREIGIINVGQPGAVRVGDDEYV
ncbi:5-dehydro-4-deoxy-D-glucuronate isomerase, partial [Pseudomonas sp. GW456-E7]